MRIAVVDLASSRPVWSAPPATVDAIVAAFGDGWEVRRVADATSSDGDGSTGSAEAVRLADGAEVYIGWGVPAGVARAASELLRWAHSAAAGAGGAVTPEFLATGATLTNSRGVYGEPMADTVLTAIGFCVRGFHDAVRAQRDRRWAKDHFTSGAVRLREFADLNVGLVGLGGIGRALAARCAALGMHVRAVRRHPARPVPPGVLWARGPEAIGDLASASDVLVLCAPQTAETQGFIDAAVLARLPEGAYVVNVARGALLDEEAVLAALDAGRLGGCVLDVFREEPLPSTHPMWGHPRVFVLPHISGVSDRYWERETALILGNIRRYLHGERLENVVDLGAGY